MRISRRSSKTPPHDLYEMELIGDPYFTVAVPIDAEEDLKRKVLGALKTHLAGQKSVDYILKRYGSNWAFPPPEEERIFYLKVLRASDNVIGIVTKELFGRTDRPDHVGLFAAEMALIRLKATFRSTLLLIMQGYPFEAAAMCRIIIEQYGFAYSIYEIDDVEKILNIKVTKTITKLKKLFPYVGKLYGQLSSHSHLDPKDTRHYIDSKDGSLVIRYRLPEDTKIVLYYFLGLIIDFTEIVQEVSKGYIHLDRLYENSFSFREDTETIKEAIKGLSKEFFNEKTS